MSDPTTQDQERQKVYDGILSDTKDARTATFWASYFAAALEAQRERLEPFIIEWERGRDREGDWDGTLVCSECEGWGKLNADGKPSKRNPPTHTPDCKLAAALSRSTANV